MLEAELAMEAASAAVDARHAQSLWDQEQGVDDHPQQQRRQRPAPVEDDHGVLHELMRDHRELSLPQSLPQALPSLAKPVARILAETEQIYYGDVARLRAACKSDQASSAAGEAKGGAAPCTPPHTPPHSPRPFPSHRLPPVGPSSSHVYVSSSNRVPPSSGHVPRGDTGVTPGGSPVGMRAGSFNEAARRSAMEEVWEMQRARSDPVPSSRRRTGPRTAGAAEEWEARLSLRHQQLRSSCSLPAISVRRA